MLELRGSLVCPNRLKVVGHEIANFDTASRCLVLKTHYGEGGSGDKVGKLSRWIDMCICQPHKF